MRKRSQSLVLKSAVPLAVLVLTACGGGGGGAASSAPPAAAPAPSGTGAPIGAIPTQLSGLPPAASLAGPSNLASGTSGKFQGSTLPAGQAVTIVIQQPSGAETSSAAVVDDQGRLSHDFTPGRPGVYMMRVTDSSGRELAAASVIAH